MPTGEETFRSKVDAWLAVVAAAGAGSTWIALARRVWEGRPVDALDLGLAIVVPGFVLWVFSTTYYVLSGDSLKVYSGPIRRTVPLQSITRLRPTHDPLSAPALSLDRIEVTYGSKRLLVSPQNKDAFAAAVVARVPRVELQGFAAPSRA